MRSDWTRNGRLTILSREIGYVAVLSFTLYFLVAFVVSALIQNAVRKRYNKRFEQTPDANVSTHGSPGFHVYVWPSRARLPLGTAQLKSSVISHRSSVLSRGLSTPEDLAGQASYGGLGVGELVGLGVSAGCSEALRYRNQVPRRASGSQISLRSHIRRPSVEFEMSSGLSHGLEGNINLERCSFGIGLYAILPASADGGSLTTMASQASTR